MPLSRLIILIIGFGIIVGLMLWLIAGIHRLYLEISWTSPFLANILVFLLVILFILLIVTLIYYLNLFSVKSTSDKYRKSRLRKKIPVEKTQAAQENLKALRQQVTQIEDDITKQALLNRSRTIEANLARGNLQVIIFGTGSAGKTSLVNALVGEIVGAVEATMGTTTSGETYTLKFKGLERTILITDTPGILEAGIPGTKRGELARELATKADLLLFVVDNDLRQSEFESLEALAQIGKRSLLVFNKLDLYTDEEQNVILNALKQRVKGLIPSEDVIAIAANPQPVQLESGDVFQPEAEIIPLIKRLVAVLQAEGEDLIAENILLQSQRLGEEARKLLDLQRRKKADQIIDRFQWIGAGVIAVTPLPVVDLLAAAAVNAQMVVEIGQIYGCELNKERGKELALSLGKTLVSLGVVKGALDLLSRALQLNFATYIVGKAIQAITAAYLTRIAGKSFIEYFRHDQDWGDGGITEVVQQQFQLSRKDEFVKAFVQDAISRVVKPITDTLSLEEGETEAIEYELEEQELAVSNYLESEDEWSKPKNDDW